MDIGREVVALIRPDVNSNTPVVARLPTELPDCRDKGAVSTMCGGC